MKHLLAIARLCVSGSHRADVGNFLIETALVSQNDPTISDRILDVLHIPISQVPTNVARNKLVKVCQEKKVDFLYMVDDDAGPSEGWFKTAFLHLVKEPPCVIGAPYCCGSTNEEVQVFHFASPNNDAQQSFTLLHINREDAARRTGIEEVANIGTHCVAYNMRVFDLIKPPYYEYAYNADHTAVIETEDTNCHRKLYFAGVPLFCAWDFWASHYKTRQVLKPYIVQRADIQETYMNQSKAELTHPFTL